MSHFCRPIGGRRPVPEEDCGFCDSEEEGE
jgi:hypothetical protein